MKVLKAKDAKEILTLMQEIQSLSHVTGQVTDSVKRKLAAVETLLSEMHGLTQLKTSFEKSSRDLTKNIDELKSSIVSKNS